MLVDEYLLTALIERQRHLRLDTPCIERGGNSTHHKGVLAQYLDTPIYGRPADLCHACNNASCSNAMHLYWGTRRENVQDSINAGTFKSPWDTMVSRYGYEEACRRNGLGDKSAGGKAQKGIPKSAEHRRKISESLRGRGEAG